MRDNIITSIPQISVVACMRLERMAKTAGVDNGEVSRRGGH